MRLTALEAADAVAAILSRPQYEKGLVQYCHQDCKNHTGKKELTLV